MRKNIRIDIDMENVPTNFIPVLIDIVVHFGKDQSLKLLINRGITSDISLAF